MIAKQLVAATLVAALFTFFFYCGSRPYDRRDRLVMFFLAVFGAAMIGGLGLQPVGPQLQGVYWLPFFSAGLLSAVLIMLLQSRNFRFGRQSIADKLEQGALAIQIQRVTTRVLRLLFGVVATMWVIGMFVRFVLP